MASVHYLFIALFILLAINRDTRKACVVFLVSYFLYENYIIPLDSFSYYHFCALLNLFIGLLVIKDNFIVGCLSFSLIPVNLFGYFLFIKYYDPTFYDNISLIIISLQILTLTIRSLHGIFTRSNGDGRLSYLLRLLVVRLVDSDSVWKDKVKMEKIS